MIWTVEICQITELSMAKKGDKKAEMEDLASTYSEDDEVYSNPDIDFAAELQYLQEKAIKCEKKLKEQKKLTAKWETSSKQSHALVVELSDKNVQNEHLLKHLLEENDKLSKQK